MSQPPPPPRQGLLFVGGMDDGRVAAALEAADLALLKPIDLALFPRARLDVAVIDPSTFGIHGVAELHRAAERLGQTPFIILSGPGDRDSLIATIALPNTRAIVARDQVDSDRALARAIDAVIHGPRFGLEAQVPGDAPRFETQVPSSEDRGLVLSRLADFAGLQRVRRRLNAIAVDVTEELITNALYDAPTDGTGRRIYAEIDRRHAVFLAPKARPTVRAAVTDRELIVSVTDPHGSLELATVRRFLVKGLRGGPDQIDGKRGGAGLGFARIFALVDRLEIRVRPGERSEITVAIALRGTRRDIASRPTGLVLAGGPLRG